MNSQPAAPITFEIYHDGGSRRNLDTATLSSIADITALQGDKQRGRDLFFGRATCFTCHALEGRGFEIGPDLKTIAQKFGADYLLDSILNPSAAITFGYENATIVKKDGSSFSGFIIADGDPVIVKDLGANQHVIPASQIKSKDVMATSIMPSAKALGLDNQQLADIVVFLQSLE